MSAARRSGSGWLLSDNPINIRALLIVSSRSHEALRISELIRFINIENGLLTIHGIDISLKPTGFLFSHPFFPVFNGFPETDDNVLIGIIKAFMRCP